MQWFRKPEQEPLKKLSNNESEKPDWFQFLLSTLSCARPTDLFRSDRQDGECLIVLLLVVSGDRSDETLSDHRIHGERDRRAPDQPVAAGDDGPADVLPGRPDDGPLRVQPVPVVQEVFGHRTHGRLAQTGADDKPHHCRRGEFRW